MKKIINSPLNKKKGYLVTLNQNIDSWIVQVDEVKLRLDENFIITGYKTLNQVTEIDTIDIIDTIEKLNKVIYTYDCNKNIDAYLELSGFEWE